jgi:N-acetylglucosamine-6-phosphate deacetylase
VTRLGVARALVDGELVPGDVRVEDGRVAEVGLATGRGVGTAVPGMVDLQVNGYAGVDFLTAPPEQWLHAARAMARDGVTSFVANLITSPAPMVEAAVGAAGRVAEADEPATARCLGAHLEGPFLSPARRGTHPVEHLRDPDLEHVGRLVDTGPVVGLTIAPELPGALDVIAALRRQGLLVALGHSDADAERAHAGFDAGATTVTHVFNGMSQPTSRAPGLTGVALARPDVAVQMICDGVHLAPETAALVLRAAPSRFVLVTDALSAAAAPDGTYRLGDVPVTRTAGAARNARGGLAGSVLRLADALAAAVSAGARLEDALAAVSSRPADLLGRPDLGRLRPGLRGDVVVLDDALTVVAVHVAGERVP